MPLDLAAGHAWLERHGKRPYRLDVRLWEWYSAAESHQKCPSLLPDAVARRLKATFRGDHWSYGEKESALADAARAVAETLAAGELED